MRPSGATKRGRLPLLESWGKVSKIPPELIAAYEATRYVVDAPGEPFTLIIGESTPRLREFYRSYDAETAAFLTAWNPFSEQASESDNRAWQAELERRAEALASVQIKSCGVGPSGDWEPEDSTLIIGISLADATTLGRSFRQNAFVWCGEDTVPELILLR
jgi:hypothetical protein